MMYTDYFALRERPFQLTPDARYYFDSRTHKKAMAYLGYGLAQGEGFIVITGEVGSGKSTLVAHLMETIDRARLNVVNIASTQVEGDDMLRLVAQGLGLATEGLAKAQLLERVEQHLEEQLRSGRRTLLIVDEAQNLTISAIEELRMLSNYHVAGKAMLQIVLLGQPEFREKLQSDLLEQLRQRVIASHHLDAMGDYEVGPYIEHRLALAGAKGRPAFSEDGFAAIHRRTGGIPRRVNKLAGRILLHAAIEKLDRIDADVVEAVVADAMAEGLQKRPDRVVPLRFATSADSAPAQDEATEQRLASIEARQDEQEAALRRVLTLLVEWVEKGQDKVGYRHNAA
jgi:putative secretion ATPase (PEP-CTERM system associated)